MLFLPGFIILVDGKNSDIIYNNELKVIEKETISYSREICSVEPAMLYENIGDVSALVVAKGDL